MAGDGQHQIMTPWIHDLDLRAQRLPQAGKARNCCLIFGTGIFERRQDLPAAMEQACKAGFRPRLLGAGDRVGGYEQGIGGQMRRDGGDRRALDRAHIGDDRSSREMHGDAGRDRFKRPDRRCQHDQIGTGHSGGKAVGDLAKPERHCLRPHFRGMVI